MIPTSLCHNFINIQMQHSSHELAMNLHPELWTTEDIFSINCSYSFHTSTKLHTALWQASRKVWTSFRGGGCPDWESSRRWSLLITSLMTYSCTTTPSRCNYSFYWIEESSPEQSGFWFPTRPIQITGSFRKNVPTIKQVPTYTWAGLSLSMRC